MRSDWEVELPTCGAASVRVCCLSAAPAAGRGRASLPAAIVEALRGGQGDLLTNVTLTSYWWSVPFYDQDGWTVVGDVVRTR